ncbi:MAG: hypothetical protein ABIK28_03400, partial [Planctomycetota bacterium]
MIRCFLVLAFLSSSPFLGFSDTIHVPADHPTIQEAIDVALDGDTIVVAPGTYPENISISNQQITLMSSDGPEVTILRNESSADKSVVNFANTPAETVFEGFTVENGTLGGINCSDSFCVIKGNIISNNEANYMWNG